ncbi:methyltransferase domain-containing protein [Brachyspira pilosicoli]|uniref:methyltransferase domain-containing protein n=1 Tax=Brachyspira pilosicoli TaxID=52584 RepID=UPI0012F4900A|nr:methyltransferase domain-containing protein [Brachyspira pilosicoli]
MNLKELQKIYDETFWENNDNGNTSYKSSKIILGMLLKYYNIKSMIDVGCGIGAWLKSAIEFGIDDVVGIDCNEISEEKLLVPRKYIKIDNLETHKNIYLKKYDIAVSLEVAEHLSPEYSENFIKMLTSYSDIVLFSAAIPNQIGTNHINCQKPEFWFKYFDQLEYKCFDFRYELMSLNISPSYSQNILLYVHKNIANKFNNFLYTEKPVFFYHPFFVQFIIDNNDVFNLEIIRLNNYILELNNKKNDTFDTYEKYFNLLTIFNFTLFGIKNIKKYLIITILGLKITLKINEKNIDKIAWWIPVKKWRESFRAKFKVRPDQTRPDQTRPDQTRPDQTRPDQTRPNSNM